VLNGIAAAERVGFSSIKINCVVQRGVNEDQMLPLAEHFRGTSHVLRFIEYMDVGNCNEWQAADVLSSQEIYHRLHARWPLQALERHYQGEVAERYAYQDGKGEIGFVSSISAPFCGDCHRVRVSANAQMFTCLFASSGIDLRSALAQGEYAIRQAIVQRWQQRVDRYSEERAGLSKPRKKIEMFFIGG
jgi:GTP 3',8-cyclase